MNSDLEKSLVAKINDLFIMFRQEYLEQFKSNYVTRKGAITDWHIKQHLSQHRTFGIKLGKQGLTKFVTFDVDVRDNLEHAEYITIQLVKQIHEYYGIDLDDIHVEFSGNKGYHVSIFFDEVMQIDGLKSLYYELLERLELTMHEVEFRPTSSNGLKLPLSKHRKTNKFMCFCNFDIDAERIYHLSESESYEYLLEIEPIKLVDFRDLVINDFRDKEDEQNDIVETILNVKQANEYESLLSQINLQAKSVRELEREIVKVIEDGHLTYASSRHRMTLLLSMFFKEQGFEQDETIEFINSIMLNTFESHRELISADTTQEYALKEVKRLVTLAYERDYKLNTKRKDVRIYKHEIETILSIKQLHLKKLMFSILVHSKRYANNKKSSHEYASFYMPYSIMTRMGNSSNRSRLLKYLIELESLELIEITSRNKIDLAKTKSTNRVVSHPNRYRVLLGSNQDNDKGILLKSDDTDAFEKCVSKFFKKGEVRKFISRKEWENTFSKYY